MMWAKFIKIEKSWKHEIEHILLEINGKPLTVRQRIYYIDAANRFRRGRMQWKRHDNLYVKLRAVEKVFASELELDRVPWRDCRNAKQYLGTRIIPMYMAALRIAYLNERKQQRERNKQSHEQPNDK